MNGTQASEATLWPLVVYGAAAALIVGAMVGVSWFLGGRHHGSQTGEPYESGIVTTGSARLRFPVSFYLVATFFLIFDLEAVFVFAWAVAVRPLGWSGFVEVSIFVGVLLAALVYLWRLGALDFVPRRARPGEGRRS